VVYYLCMKTKSTNNSTTKALKSLISTKVRNFRKLKLKELPLEKFNGAGIYALYYTGSDDLYRNSSKSGVPVYIGRVQPNLTQVEPNLESAALYSKIKEQCKSIEDARNLAIEDFQCKYMVLDQAEMSLSEAIEGQLINQFRPTWNVCVEGFANHDPGKSRLKQAPSEWDVLHPGRSWAKKLQGKAKTKGQVKNKMKKFEQALPV